jgi:hypothetical protein
MASVSPDEVCRFKKPTDGFLCKLSDNKYGIDFLAFTVKDYDTKRKIFHVDRCVTLSLIHGGAFRTRVGRDIAHMLRVLLFFST